MRRLALAVVILLLAAACGDDDDAATVAPGATTTTVAAQPATSPSAPSQPTTVNGGAEVRPDESTSSETTSTTAAPPPDSTGPPGSFAPALLQRATGERIVVEVASESGAEPQRGTIDHVVEVLSAATGKSVTVDGGGTPPATDGWTTGNLRAAVSAVARTPQGGGTVVVRLLFVHGHWADDDTVLGVSFQADAAAIFVDDVRGASDPIVAPGAIEVATTTHEVGHLLGLVDLYLHTDREDPEHPGHSTNRGSVMYWAVESSLVTDLLTGGPPRNFDDADRADLATIRG